MIKAFRRFKTYILTLPFLLMYKLKPGTFDMISEFISILPFATGRKIRYEFYKRTLKSCGENVTFRFGTVLRYDSISIGDNVGFNSYVNVGFVDFGSNIMVSNNCSFIGGRKTHNFSRTDIPMKKQGIQWKKITIGNDVWIGANAVIMESVGDGCIIGAGSVVTREVEPFGVAVGNPAKVIRKRDSASDDPPLATGS